MDDVRLLPACPTFSMVVGESSRGSKGYKPIKDEEHTEDINISICNPSPSRPSGVKKREAEEGLEWSSYKVARSVDKFADALQQSANEKRKTAYNPLQFDILKTIKLPEDLFNSRLDGLLKQAAEMQTDIVPNIRYVPPCQPSPRLSFSYSGPNYTSFQDGFPRISSAPEAKDTKEVET